MSFTRLRLVALIAAAMILLPAVAVAVAVSPFVDVPTGGFYQAPGDWAFSNGITNGTDTSVDAGRHTSIAIGTDGLPSSATTIQRTAP